MPNNKNTQSTASISTTSVPTPPSIRVFYDRRKGSIDGFLTVIDATTGKKLLDKLPARSGQNGYTETNWVPAKSPIPLWQPQVNYYLHLTPIENGEVFPKTASGIGLFFPISTHPHNPDLIEQGKNRRWHMGLHPENAYPGSAGCIVLLWNTPVRKAKVKALFTLLQDLGKTQAVVELTVL
ncbi:MAG: hypothetical protein H2174_09345 [Vampirovibrio sp.]|jgi:hypothetical protein|nr:hypothetical protein [Vampirovibrio sp.]